MKLILNLFALSLLVNSSAYTTEVDPKIGDAIRNQEPWIRVLVHLKGRLDIEKKIPSWEPNRAQSAVRALETFHRSAMYKVTRSLDASWSEGDVQSFTPLWIVNSFQVTATPQWIEALTRAEGIEKIELETRKEISPLDEGKACLTPPQSRYGFVEEPQISWAVTHVGATELWKKDIKGKSSLVAMIDTGANIDHPDLKGNVWVNAGEQGNDSEGRDKGTNGIDDDANGYIDDINGFNFEANNNKIMDDNGHGTQTAGIVAGTGAEGKATGMAPAAKVMILKSCCSGDGKVFESSTWAAIQYALKNGARIISMSLSLKPYNNPTYAKWRELSEAVLATGVIHINSAGNLGPDNVPHNMGAPATNPPAWFHPNQTPGRPSGIIVVGATDEKDELRYYSSTGPVTWEDIEPYKDYPYEGGKKPGLVRPDVCGPSEMPSLSMTGKGYTASFGGTSSATPAVAGVAALLLSAKPGLNIVQMSEALQMSAKVIGGGYNNRCGAGRVDAVKGLEYVMSKF